MRLRCGAATGALILSAITIPASPATADALRSDQWYLRTLKVSAAHALSRGAGVTVAVLDTGVYPHRDLKRNLLAGTSVIPGDSGNAKVDKVGHGTNMAALIAAHGRNGRDGILGIAPAAKILPVKYSNHANKASSDDMTAAVEWATSHGAKVINISAAAGPAFGLIEAVDAAIKNDVVVVASIGNRSVDPIAAYPSAIDGVLAVGATDRQGRHASLSTKDSKVQICAPGVGITTAEPPNRYADVDGTSPSSAIVAGAAALVRAKFPELSAKDVINRLTATADDIGPPGRDNECGFGLLNIVKALTADVPSLTGGTATPAASGSASPTAATGSVTAVPTTAAAGSAATRAGSSARLIFGVLGGLVVAGALVTALVVRRWRRS
jgi:type VII secretion-associated serine protease mycosin